MEKLVDGYLWAQVRAHSRIQLGYERDRETVITSTIASIGTRVSISVSVSVLVLQEVHAHLPSRSLI